MNPYFFFFLNLVFNAAVFVINICDELQSYTSHLFSMSQHSPGFCVNMALDDN